MKDEEKEPESDGRGEISKKQVCCLCGGVLLVIIIVLG